MFVPKEVEFKSAKELSEYKKSLVRPKITYIILGFYGICTLILGGIILFNEIEFSSELLTIYTGLSTLTASIVSFWFGGRGASKTSSAAETPPLEENQSSQQSKKPKENQSQSET